MRSLQGAVTIQPFAELLPVKTIFEKFFEIFIFF